MFFLVQTVVPNVSDVVHGGNHQWWDAEEAWSLRHTDQYLSWRIQNYPMSVACQQLVGSDGLSEEEWEDERI